MIQNWDRLRVFAAVATHTSISTAAEQLHISGSAVTQHVRKLEREIGDTLVQPFGRGIQLTAAGSRLARCCHAMLREVATTEHALAELTGVIGGPVKIGSAMSAIRSLLGPALAEMVQKYPALEPTIIDGEAVDFIDLLGKRQLDAAIIETWNDSRFLNRPSMNSRLILEEPVDMAVPTGLQPRPKRIADAAKYPWVVCPQRSEAYQTLTDTLRRAGFEADVRYEITAYSSQLDLVASGLAVALVPRLAQVMEPDSGITFVPLVPAITRQLHLMTRHGDDRPVLAALTEALEPQV